jgi:hypothetical protein
MMNPRLILAALLLATPMLHAQDAAQPQKEPAAIREPYRITITLKSTDKNKITTQNSYTVVATTNTLIFRDNPGIRDDSNVPVKMSTRVTEDLRCNTDIDFRNFSRVADSVYLNLTIDTQNYAEGISAGEPGTEQTHFILYSRRLTVTPMLPIGKLTTVYSSVDAVNGIKLEVQVLVQPLNAK